jgi:hypothetical protein
MLSAIRQGFLLKRVQVRAFASNDHILVTEQEQVSEHPRARRRAGMPHTLDVRETFSAQAPKHFVPLRRATSWRN